MEFCKSIGKNIACIDSQEQYECALEKISKGGKSSKYLLKH